MIVNIKEKLIGLQHTPFQFILAAMASIGHTCRRRSLSLIYQDRDGDWVNKQNDVTFINPSYSTLTGEEVRRDMLDFWCHEYMPKHGDLVVDIGAGIGDEVVFFSRLVGPGGRVIAIEANPRTFRCLEKTIKANGLENVTTVQMAISDTDGELFIEDADNHQANRVGGSHGLRVSASTLDKLLQDLGASNPALVKINIEGAETAAIRGARETLQSQAHWVISCHDFLVNTPGFESSATYSDVFAMVEEAGLQISPSREDNRPWIPFHIYATHV